MPNINKNIIMQAGAAVANATNKAAGLSASTPEPGTIISAIQLVNGGRTIGPDAIAHFTESVRNKLLSLLVSLELIQSGSGTPSPDNVRPISGSTGLTIYVSPTHNVADATTYSVDWTSEAGTVYGGTVDVVTGVLTVDRAAFNAKTVAWQDAGSGRVYTLLSLSPTELTTPLCSHCEYHRRPATGAYDNWIDWGGYPNSNKNLIVTLKGITDTLSQWNTYIQNNDVQFVYELDTPLTYQIIGTDIVTLVGDNYIWSDSGDITITE